MTDIQNRIYRVSQELFAARRYWRPLLKQLAGDEDPAAEATAMFCVNAIIQMAFSIELQREILGRCIAEEIAARYGQVIEQPAGIAQATAG